MKLIFLGSGSAFVVGQNYHSNMLLQNDHGKFLLIDCGTDARFSLSEQGLSYSDIHDVYISHLHADHAGGLEWLGFETKFDSKCNKPNLYISKHLVGGLWDNLLKGGMNSLQMEQASLSSFFNLRVIDDNGTFHWEGQKFQMVQTIHVVSNFLISPSYGLLFTANHLTIFISTDTQFCITRYRDVYQLADIIFHDCETKKNKSEVHAHYTELLSLELAIRAKMWLYHCDTTTLPDAKKDGFRGFVTKGQCFDFNNPDTLE